MYISAEDKKEYLISEVLILGGEAYEAYRDKLKSMPPDPSGNAALQKIACSC